MRGVFATIALKRVILLVTLRSISGR